MRAPLRWVRGALAVLSALAVAVDAGAQTASEASCKASSSRECILGILNPVHFGVPSSPAFELLPGQPTEIPNVLTPADLQSTVRSWVDGGKLRAGVGLDTRPFVRSGGDLRTYAENSLRQVLFRTVLSAGTAIAPDNADDVILAAGVRIPIIDLGDPRGDLAYQNRLATRYTDALKALGQPPFTMTAEHQAARLDSAATAVDSVRKNYAASHWNAVKLDVGLAGSVRSLGGNAAADSVRVQQGGVWLALALPLAAVGQLTLAGKAVWAETDTATDEAARYVGGVRLLLFASDRFSLAFEGSTTWTRFDDDELNDDWLRVGTVVEWHVPELGGWIGVGYGGSRGRDDGQAGGLSLQYSFYRDRVLTR
jgi:hypothetical protein